MEMVSKKLQSMRESNRIHLHPNWGNPDKNKNPKAREKQMGQQ
jgi:hypothetical protein